MLHTSCESAAVFIQHCSHVDCDLHRFESLEPEMNNQASRVAVVNQIARQLMHNGHPSEKDIKTQQDKLNNRYKQTQNLKMQ